MDEKPLMTLANERNFAGLEDAWLTALGRAEIPVDEMLRVLEWLYQRVKDQEQVKTLGGTLLEALAEQGDSRAETAAQRLLGWFPDEAVMRSALGCAMVINTPEHPAMQGIVQCSGLCDGGPLRDALTYIEVRRAMPPGRFLLHRARRTPVRVEGFDSERDAVRLNDGASLHDADLQTVQLQYEPCADDDFRVVQLFRPEELRDEAQCNPVALARRFLKFAGKRATFREFKDALVPHIIPDDEWKQWWSTARVALLHDPMIELGDGSQPALSLRDTPRDYGETLRRDFDHAESPREQCALLMHYAAQVRQGIPPVDEYLTHIQATMRGFTSAPDQPIAALFAWLTLQATADVLGGDIPAYQPAWLQTPGAALQAAQWCGWERDVGPVLVDALRHADPDWPALCAAMLPFAPLPLLDAAVAALRAAGKNQHIVPMLNALAEPSVEMAEALAWLWREMAEKPDVEPAPPLSLIETTHAVFRAMRQLHTYRGAPTFNARGALAAIRHLIAAKKYELVSRIFATLGAEHAADLYQAMTSNSGISTAMRAQLATLLSRVGLARRTHMGDAVSPPAGPAAVNGNQ